MASGIELAKAYVQIIPSAEGISGKIQEAMGDESQKAGDDSGKKFGSGFIKKAQKFIKDSGIGKFVTASLFEGANLQQSLGGVETLFKGSADKVKQYASQSFKTVGISSNEYMEMATSFSAGLINSLAGDTDKAAEITNMALTDMGDNANKMGTDMQSLQYAYQGFARGNYTMLDNLKLGYGGTKEEMERLLEDAEKLTGVHYDINNLADVYQAIHAIQQETGITGTTAEEAATTFSGSFNMLKSSLKDFLGNLSLGQDIMPSLENLASSFTTFFFDNMLPMLGNMASSIVTTIMEHGPEMLAAGVTYLSNMIQGFVQKLPEWLAQAPALIKSFGDGITANLPTIIQGGIDILISLINGIIDSLPALLESAVQLLDSFLTCIGDNLPRIIDMGMELLMSLIDGILGKLPDLLDTAADLVVKVVEILATYDWIGLGMKILTNLVNGVLKIVPKVKTSFEDIRSKIIEIISKLPGKLLDLGSKALTSLGRGVSNGIGTIRNIASNVASTIINQISSLGSRALSIGGNIVSGLWNGISNKTSWLIGRIQSFAGNVLGSIKSFFGIKSPSRVFRDEVGLMLVQGLGKGITDNLDIVQKSMSLLSDEATGTVTADLALRSQAIGSTVGADIAGTSNTPIFEIVNEVTVDGKVLKEITSNYTIKKINDKAKSDIRRKGGVVYGS